MASTASQIGLWLGGDAIPGEAALLERVERQLDPPAIQKLLDLGFTREEVYSIVIPARTLQHRRSRRERLSLEESDRLVRTLRVLSLAETLYESRERALAWLRRPNPRLENRVPLSLLRTDTGARMVEELLGGIGEGYFL